MRPLDIALCLFVMLPDCKYGGSLTANNKESFDKLRWEDDRSKPTWEEVQDYWINNQGAFDEFYNN